MHRGGNSCHVKLHGEQKKEQSERKREIKNAIYIYGTYIEVFNDLDSLGEESTVCFIPLAVLTSRNEGSQIQCFIIIIISTV